MDPLKSLLSESTKKIWKDVAEHTLKKAGEAVAIESVKALFEIWKRRKIRQDEWEFSEWKRELKEARDDAEKKAREAQKAKEKAAGSGPKQEGDSSEEDAARSPEGDDAPAESPKDDEEE